MVLIGKPRGDALRLSRFHAFSCSLQGIPLLRGGPDGAPDPFTLPPCEQAFSAQRAHRPTAAGIVQVFVQCEVSGVSLCLLC